MQQLNLISWKSINHYKCIGKVEVSVLEKKSDYQSSIHKKITIFDNKFVTDKTVQYIIVKGCIYLSMHLYISLCLKKILRS